MSLITEVMLRNCYALVLQATQPVGPPRQPARDSHLVCQLGAEDSGIKPEYVYYTYFRLVHPSRHEHAIFFLHAAGGD